MTVEKIEIPPYFKEKAPLKGLFFAFSNIIVIVFSSVVAYHYDVWYGYIIAFIIVGARAQSLYILQHECMHWLIFKKRSYNDLLGIIISGIIGTKLYEGRVYHFKHHKEVGNSEDPNEIFHNLNHLTGFGEKAFYFLSQLFGVRLFHILANLLNPPKRAVGGSIGIKVEGLRIDLIAIIICQAIIVVTITLLSSFWMYIFFYFLPIITLTSFFESIRSFSEHTLPGEISTSYAEEHRLFFMNASSLELFFISQFNFHYHHLHHIYPYVVTFKLKELHKWLTLNNPHYSELYIQRDGYVQVLWQFLFNREFSGCGKVYPKKMI